MTIDNNIFGSILPENDDNFDLSAIHNEQVDNADFPVDDSYLDIDTFAIAAAAFICLDADPMVRDLKLFTHISPILHPDKDVADYAIHHARKYICNISDRFTAYNKKGRTIYRDIEIALHGILLSLYGSEQEIEKCLITCGIDDAINNYFDRSVFWADKYIYSDDPFFALAVCIYSSLKCSAAREETVSLMYQILPFVELAPEFCYSIIDDTIQFVIHCFGIPFRKTQRVHIIMWYIFKFLADYFETNHNDLCAESDDDKNESNLSDFDALNSIHDKVFEIGDDIEDDEEECDDPDFDPDSDLSDAENEGSAVLTSTVNCKFPPHCGIIYDKNRLDELYRSASSLAYKIKNDDIFFDTVLETSLYICLLEIKNSDILFFDLLRRNDDRSFIQTARYARKFVLNKCHIIIPRLKGNVLDDLDAITGTQIAAFTNNTYQFNENMCASPILVNAKCMGFPDSELLRHIRLAAQSLFPDWDCNDILYADSVYALLVCLYLRDRYKFGRENAVQRLCDIAETLGLSKNIRFLDMASNAVLLVDDVYSNERVRMYRPPIVLWHIFRVLRRMSEGIACDEWMTCGCHIECENCEYKFASESENK